MSGRRVFFYVQHLMGVGHVFRATRIVQALVAAGFEVDLVLGGEPIPGIATHGARVHQLPPVRAGEAVFNKLVGSDGEPVTDAWKEARRDLLLDLFRRAAPDVVMTEAFPFGRRQMRFELVPLMEAAVSRDRPPLVVGSVRDILQENARPERDHEVVDLVRRFFEGIVVHGDPAFCRLEDTFPLAARIADRIVYSGIVAPEPGPTRLGNLAEEAFDVVVSVGGGALGHRLLVAAMKARPLSSLKDARWLVLTGIRHTPSQRAELEALSAEGMTLRDFAPDLPSLLARTGLSVSRAGYNTVADIAIAGCRSVVIPLADGTETEQIHRAALLDRLGYAVAVPHDTETPAALAAAIDRAMAQPASDRSALRLDGAATTAALISGMLGQPVAPGR